MIENFFLILLLILRLFIGVVHIREQWQSESERYSDNSTLDYIRETYEIKLKSYYKNHKPRSYLISKHCELRLIQDKKGNISFYCKERTDGIKSGRYFDVKGDSVHASTMWAIIDMEFNKITNFFDVKELYYSLNQGLDTTGGLKYYNEPVLKKLPEAEINKSAQNEYCRMEVQLLPNGEKVIVCSEIWGEKVWNKPKSFVISASTPILYGILAEFEKTNDKMLQYQTLLYRYTARSDCKVTEVPINKDINTENKNVKKEVKKTNNILQAEIKEDVEPIPYLHVDIKEEETKEQNIRNIEPKNTETESNEQNINKYDERHLDL